MAELKNNYANMSLAGLKTNSEQFTSMAAFVNPPRSVRHLSLKPARTAASFQ